MPVKGTLYLDAGAAEAVRKNKKSLFPAGIVATSGSFNMQDAVRICDSEGLEIARGLINYPRNEVEKIRVSVQGTHLDVGQCSACILDRHALEAVVTATLKMLAVFHFTL